MCSISFSLKLAVAVFSGFVFHVACHDSHRECFDVESKTICYFMPNVSPVNWETAWKTCGELDATLPIILDEKGQKALVDYLTKYFPVQPVWAAGRYIGNRGWRWLNNQTVRLTDEPNCTQGRIRNVNCTHETQALLTKNLTYEAIFPNYDYNYICRFSGVNCTNEAQKSTSWKGDCLYWTTNHKLRLYEARNDCLKGGGDLATFSEDGDLQHLQRFSSVMKDADDKGYLIGLHRKWWIWNATDVHDIKYNLLNDYGNTGEDCLFIDLRSKWSRDKCFVNKSVICQTEKGNRSSTDAPFTETVTVLTASPVEMSTASSASTGDSDIRTVTVLTVSDVEMPRASSKSTEESDIRTAIVLTASPVEASITSGKSTQNTDIRTVTVLTASPVETSTASRASTDDSGIFTSTSSKRGNQATSTRASAILHVTSTWSNRKSQNTSTSESIILHATSTWSPRENQSTSTSESVILHVTSPRENQNTSTSESVILHGFSTERLVAIITGVTVGLVIFIVVLIFSLRKLCRKKATDEKDRQSDGNQTQAAECKDTDEICGFYAEVTRTVHDEEIGDTANEPQTSNVYATLEFEKSKVPKEEPITSNPHELDVVSDPAEAVPPDAFVYASLEFEKSKVPKEEPIREATGEEDRLSDGNQTLRDECKGPEETRRMRCVVCTPK